MNASSDTPASKGMKMVAAYRAARLSQRPVLRGSLQDSHTARRMARCGGQSAVEPDQQAPLESSVIAPPTPMAPKVHEPGSVFANLVSISEAVEPGEPAAPEASRGENEPAVDDLLTAAFAAAPEAPSLAEPLLAGPQPPEPVAPTPAAVAAPAYDPPLAEIGFGPGMLIRLSQLGLHTTADLARADAEQLRQELGEISRLVDVEAWILNAQQTVSI